MNLTTVGLNHNWAYYYTEGLTQFSITETQYDTTENMPICMANNFAANTRPLVL